MALEEQWWELGACRTANPAIFDGVKHRMGRPRKDGTVRYRRDWSAAKAMCASCPVQPQCLEWVLDQRTSVWDDEAFVAGFEPHEIQEIRKRRRG